MTDAREALTRPDGALDAVLQLLDRQLVDSEGRLGGKVDDVELTEDADGTLRVTGLLVGVTAWLPRLGPTRGSWWLDWWRRLGRARADRTAPGRIDVARVAEVGHDVRLDRRRDGVAEPASGGGGSGGAAADQGRRHRLDDLLELPVVAPRGTRPGHVLDVRLAPADALPSGRACVVGLVVGRRGRPGSLLGYERSPAQGPWLVAQVVRRIHRHTTYVPVEDVARIDWQAREVLLSG